MTRAAEPEEGIAAIGRDVASDAARLVRAEIDLARSQLVDAAKRLVVAVVLLVSAALLLLIAVIEALGAIPSEFGPKLFGNAWLGWLALGGIFLVVAGLLALLGTRAVFRSLREGKHTVDTLKEDGEWLKRLSKRRSNGT